MEGSQPLIVITADDIKRSGLTSLSDLMNSVNQTRGGTSSFNTSQSGATSTSTPPGQATASLRGMGPSSTLTLINGRRVAASSFASGTENFVDINSIPLAAIERIEVLATGASAIYGADAVAGVINYILKTDYEGFEVSGNYQNSTASENESQVNLQAFYGTKLGDGNLSVFADYFDRKAVKATSRASARDPILESGYSYLPKNTPNIYFGSLPGSVGEIGNPNCATALVTTEFDEDICAYYGNEDDYLLSPLESLSLGFMYQIDLGSVNWKTDFSYSQTESTSFSSPAPINRIDDSEGPFVDESVLDSFSDAFFNLVIDDLFIEPFRSPNDRRLFGFMFDARFSAPRTVEIETQSMRLVSELSGDIGSWSWNSAVILSKSESDQVASEGIYNRYKYHAALAGELCSNGDIASYDSNNEILSCGGGNLLGIYNPFLQGDPTNDSLLALTQEQPTRNGESTLYAWDVNFSGELMQFNDDYIRAAFGAEVRREEINDIPSENAQARLENNYLVDAFGFGSSLSQADRTQYGVYAEFFVPLHEQVELSLAGRFDDYNDFGSSFNPKVGLTYRPTDSIVLRGSWSTAFRAPSLTQAGVKLRTTRASFDCSANQQVAEFFCDGDGGLRGNNVLELGNPDLRAEESESISLGFAYSPTKNTDITVDYWAFDHENLVDTNMTGVLAASLTNASLRHCGLVPDGQVGISFEQALCDITDATFDPSNPDGFVNDGLGLLDQGVNMQQLFDNYLRIENPRFDELPLFRDHVLLLDNTGKQKVSGIDVSLFHLVDFDNGELELGFDATHYLSYERNIRGSDEIEELAGAWQYPRNVATAKVFWVQEDWFAGINVFFTDAYQDDIEGLRGRQIDELVALGAIDENEMRDVASWTTVTLSAGYYFENAEVRFAIDNLFDKDAPTAYGSARGFDSFNHDQFGTRYNVSLNYKF